MKPRVAICLKGAVAKISGHFFTQDSVYQDGNYVNYKACFNSIQRHIVQANNYEFDFFIHSWNEDLQDALTSLYEPKIFSFEDNRKYNDLIKSKMKKLDDFGGISNALSIKKSIENMEQYQKEKNFTYDIVIIYRFDLMLLKNIDLTKYNMNNIYNNGNAFGDPQGDFHFIMSSDNASKFKNLFESIDIGNPHHTHFWINNYIKKYMKENIIPDNIIAGTDQEVLRKINATTICMHGLPIEKLLPYGLTIDEILHYNSH